MQFAAGKSNVTNRVDARGIALPGDCLLRKRGRAMRVPTQPPQHKGRIALSGDCLLRKRGRAMFVPTHFLRQRRPLYEGSRPQGASL
ncbi:MAG: hypothetical protein IKS21_05540 [Oscillospiraceae bacterium]|nr:hypothetical protein [Oscillospiraceae bacterium]